MDQLNLDIYTFQEPDASVQDNSGFDGFTFLLYRDLRLKRAWLRSIPNDAVHIEQAGQK